MALNIELPQINGNFDVGIAVGIDPSLAADQKLPILAEGQMAAVAGYSAAWAYFRFSGEPAPCRELYAAAAAGCVLAGLCRNVGGRPDGDWNSIDVPDANVTTGVPNYIVQPDMLRRGLTIVMATKVNWWLTNHHTGQGNVLTGYVGKVMNIQFNNVITEAHIRCAHTIGHWASTINILRIAGVPGLRNVADAVPAPSIHLALSPDAALRFEGPPAGSHKNGLAAAALQRLLASRLAPFCPGIADMTEVPRVYNVIRNDRTDYHIGASYLTGRARAAYSDSAMDLYLGRLSTFIRIIFTNSTLAKSPHMTKEKSTSYPDYNPEWEAFLNAYKSAAVTTANDAMARLHQAPPENRNEDLETLRTAFRQ